MVWETIDQYHVYNDMEGLDWESIRAHYQTKVLQARNTAEFEAALGNKSAVFSARLFMRNQGGDPPGRPPDT